MVDPSFHKGIDRVRFSAEQYLFVDTCNKNLNNSKRSCAKGISQCKSCYNQRARERYHKYYGDNHRERVKRNKAKNRLYGNDRAPPERYVKSGATYDILLS